MLVRMFHVACDAPTYCTESCDGNNDPGDEYYASEARAVAKEAGFHVKGDLAICADCWEQGVRFADLEYRKASMGY